MLVPVDLRQAWNQARTCWARGEYWTAHEWLELPWRTAKDPDRTALGGVILLSAALHQASLGRRRASRRNFAKALRKLAPLDDRWRGVDLRQLEWATFVALRTPAPGPILEPLEGSTDEIRGGAPP